MDVIRSFQYKTAGRGKGVLGLKDPQPSRRPGEKRAAVEKAATSEPEKPPTAATRARDAQKRGGECLRAHEKRTAPRIHLSKCV